jgi:hypothetical protein
MHIEVTRCGELESEIHSPRNPIGRPRTNENRVLWKHVILGYLDAGNINLAPKHLETPLVDREPMKIEFPGKFLPIPSYMGETKIRRVGTHPGSL